MIFSKVAIIISSIESSMYEYTDVFKKSYRIIRSMESIRQLFVVLQQSNRQNVIKKKIKLKSP